MLDLQNKSHAVMAQRHESKSSFDDFPTPPWATRALIEHAIGPKSVEKMSCLEPACGRGYMSEPLSEYFDKVISTDVEDYGYGEVKDFLDPDFKISTDWIITNPPFKLAEEFALKALAQASRGVALLTRTVFIESIGRYNRLFSKTPPSSVAQYVERVPMVKGRLDRKASTATGYAWMIWDKSLMSNSSQMVWIPPCRKKLELAEDYPDHNLGGLFPHH